LTRIVYCHCAWAKVVPEDVKASVLRRLGDSNLTFEAVPDLCEMAARKDESLDDLAAQEELEIIACYPRAVRWLFHSAGRELSSKARIHNMREASAQEIGAALGLDAAEATP